MARKIKKWIVIVSVAAGLSAVVLGTLALLVWNGIILLNNPSKTDYPVRGVDVSSYQGKIDWQVLKKEGISFAFLKATEGSQHIDSYFADNLEGASAAGLAVGAYHFFSFESSGKAQAEHFIRTVPKDALALPPVIDFEYYGDFEKNPPDKAAVLAELDCMIELLSAHYGRAPILYATAPSYERYLAGNYPENDIWIRAVYSKPNLSDGRAWTFWQYTNRARLAGYEGPERFIDLNVFCGTKAEFEAYLNK